MPKLDANHEEVLRQNVNLRDNNPALSFNILLKTKVYCMKFYRKESNFTMQDF